jgi:hypothetical protein
MARRVLSVLLLAAACRSADTAADKTATAGGATSGDATAGATDTTAAWMLTRRDQERAMASSSVALHDFRFTDALASSGIAFVNQMVDDAGRTYKAVHYDHGSGLCAADVDGDGRTDVFFVTQRGSNGLYKNAGGGRFTDITAAAGLGAVDQIGVGCAFGDIDNDGRPDLFVTTVRHGNHLFHNDGGGTFTDITSRAGVTHSGHSSGALFFDYDGDGKLDLFVTNVGRYTTNDTGAGGYYIGVTDAFMGHLHPDRAEASILYRNRGDGRFEDVSRQTGLVDKSWSGDASIIDVDDDGRPDLYLTNMQGENHLWRNDGGTRFRDETARWFPRTPFGAMGLKVFDFNGDGRLDLFITDMHSDMIDMIDPADWSGKARKTNAAHVQDGMMPTGRAHLMFGNALFARRRGRRRRRRRVRRSVRLDGRGDVLAVGAERGRSQRRRLGRHLRVEQHELPVSVRHQRCVPERGRTALPARRIHAGRRTASWQRDAAGLVCRTVRPQRRRPRFQGLPELPPTRCRQFRVPHECGG